MIVVERQIRTRFIKPQDTLFRSARHIAKQHHSMFLSKFNIMFIDCHVIIDYSYRQSPNNTNYTAYLPMETKTQLQYNLEQ